MSAETLSAPVSAIDSIVSSTVESGIGQAISSSVPSIPEISVGDSFHPEIRMSDLITLPKHTVNINDINPDKQVPVAEVVFNQKLFEITHQFEQAQSKPRTAVLDLLSLPEHRVKEQNLHFDRSVPAPIARLIFEQTQYFEVLAQPASVDSEKIQPVLEVEPQNLKAVEAKADTQAIAEVLKQVQEDNTFTPEQKSFWEQKLIQIAQIKTQTLDKVETAIQVNEWIQTQAQPQAKTSMSQQPPRTPYAISIESQDQEPRPTQEEPLWEVHTVTEKQKVAKKSLDKRLQVAQEISDQVSQANQQDPKLVAESLVYKLDVPDIYEGIEIVQGNLEYPTVALDTQLALAAVKQEDIGGIQKSIFKSVVSKPPKEKVRIVNFEGTVKQSDLPAEPRRLAAEGNQHIVLKGGRFWKPGKTPKRKEPVELDKTNAQKPVSQIKRLPGFPASK